MAVLLAQESSDGTDRALNLVVADYWSYGQLFYIPPGKIWSLSSIDFKLYRSGTFTSPRRLELTVLTAPEGQPSDFLAGAGYAPVFMDAAALNTVTTDSGGAWYTCAFEASPPLSSGYYFVELYLTGGASASEIRWKIHTTDPYAQGNIWETQDTVNWVERAGEDGTIRINGTEDRTTEAYTGVSDPTTRRLAAVANNRFWYEDV